MSRHETSSDRRVEERAEDAVPGRKVAEQAGAAEAAPHSQRFPLPFYDAAPVALADSQLRRNLSKATDTIRDKRAEVVGELPDWEELREAGQAIKAETMARLDELLVELEQKVAAAGGVVHWARDADEANEIVRDLVVGTGAGEVIKVKSMTTDEIELNEALARDGITAIETDLAELIVQLAEEPPSHILVPAIHKNRSEIRDLFLDRFGLDPSQLGDQPTELAAAARRFLRDRFLSARVAISGANFAVAETGAVCVVESEGNGRMCTTLPQTLITVMGIEKLVPRWRDMEVFLQLLPRSSTGERMNPYTSFWTGVTEGDGPQEFHLVLLDNGRSSMLANELESQTLHCIRCSACLNICPVYSRVGGHSYGSVYPGPIGAILTPQLRAARQDDQLPYASTLCGACYEVCPVKIDIPEILVELRKRSVDRGRERRGLLAPFDPEDAAMRIAAYVFSDSRRFELAQRLARLGQGPFVRHGKIGSLPGPLSAWTKVRDLEPIPKETFREWWRRRHERA